MPAAVLVVSGIVALVYGSWRGYVAARAALLPMLREGDPTRTLIEAARPMHTRTRVRLALRHVLAATAWLIIALYGLFLATVGSALLR